MRKKPSRMEMASAQTLGVPTVKCLRRAGRRLDGKYEGNQGRGPWGSLL